MKRLNSMLARATAGAGAALLLGALPACQSEGGGATCGAGTVLDEAANECLPIPDFNIIVDDFRLGVFEMSQVDVPERLDVGELEKRTFTIKNAGTTDREVTVIRFGIAPVKERIEELRDQLAEVDDYTVLDPIFVGQAMLDDLAAGETREVEYEIWVPGEVEEGLYGFFFAVDEVPLIRNEDGDYALDLSTNVGAKENTVALGDAPLVHAPATVIVGKPDLPNLRILSAEVDNSSFELDQSENLDEAMFTITARMSSQALDLTEPVTATFELRLPGHVIDVPGQDLGESFFASEDDFLAAPEETTYRYDANRSFPLMAQRFEELIDEVVYSSKCVTEAVVDDDTGEETEVEKCAVIFSEEGLDDVYPLFLTPEAIRLLESTASHPALNPDLDEHLELVGEVVMTVSTPQPEYQDNLADNVQSFPVVFMAPEPAREALEDDEDDSGVEEVENSWGSKGPYRFPLVHNVQSQGFGNAWFGASYRYETQSSQNRHLDAVISHYQRVNHSFHGTFLRRGVDVLRVTGESDWGVDKPTSQWKSEARLIVLGVNLLNNKFTQAYCETSGGITACPVFESTVDEYTKNNPTAPGKAKSAQFFRGRKYEWRIQAGPVPILVTADIGLNIAAKLVGHFIIDNRTPVTKYGAQFAAGPELTIGVSVFGGISIGIARAGVEGSLNLVSVDFLPLIRPLVGALYDPSQGCFRAAEAQLDFEGPITVRGPHGSISVVAYAGVRICFFKCWRIEKKVFSLTLASFSSWQKTWNLWSVSSRWQRRPGQWGMCANPVTPPPAVTWRSPTSCRNGYCASSSRNRPGNFKHWVSNVTGSYRRTYTLQGTSASCADVRITGRTRADLDRAVIYDANGNTMNNETHFLRIWWFRIPWGTQVGWSGNINRTQRVCSSQITVAMESSANVSGQPGVTVVFTPTL